MDEFVVAIKTRFAKKKNGKETLIKNVINIKDRIHPFSLMLYLVKKLTLECSNILDSTTPLYTWRCDDQDKTPSFTLQL